MADSDAYSITNSHLKVCFHLKSYITTIHAHETPIIVENMETKNTINKVLNT